MLATALARLCGGKNARRRLRLALTDNGHGLPAARLAADMDGLANMRSRLGKMGGRFAIASLTDRGTTVRLYMPLK